MNTYLATQQGALLCSVFADLGFFNSCFGHTVVRNERKQAYLIGRFY